MHHQHMQHKPSTMELPYLLISILLLLLASYLFRRKPANLPPTVFPTLPIIGHLYLLKLPLYRTLAKVSAKYGPILLLRFGFRRVLVISSPSAAEGCLSKNDIIFANRPHLLFGKIIGDNYTSFAWSSHGEHWRNLRRIATLEIFSTRRLNEFHDVRVDECKRLIRKLMSDSSPVNFKPVFRELAMNIMMRMIFGKRYFGGDISTLEEEGKRFQDMMDEASLLSGAANVVDYLPIMSWLVVRRVEKRLITLRERMKTSLLRLMEQVKRSKGEMKNTKRLLLDVLLSLQESNAEYYTNDMIRSFIQVMLFAGTDTLSGTMVWCLALLLNHPQVLQMAQNEIDSKVGKDRLVDESDMVNLPYLHAIISETLRLYPAAPLLLPHESSQDCIIEGYNVPRGTMLLVNVWAIQHDPKLFTDPERFNPERFVGLEGARDGFKLMPFGSGRRGCPGEGLAIRTLVLTMGLLIQCFNWERLGDKPVDMTPGLGATLPKAEPLIAKCKPRPEMQDVLAQL